MGDVPLVQGDDGIVEGDPGIDEQVSFGFYFDYVLLNWQRMVEFVEFVGNSLKLPFMN